MSNEQLNFDNAALGLNEKVLAPIDRFFHPVTLASDLKNKPLKVVVHGQSFVLFRNNEGEIGALRDRCPHRFAPLSEGRIRPDGRLQCPYHGWRFKCDGEGESPSQPSLKNCDVEALHVVEKYGFIWLASKTVSPSTIPEYAWDDFSLAGVASTIFEAPLHVVLDNFSEDEHTPFVHHALGWEEKDCDSIKFEAENFNDHTDVKYRAVQRPVKVLKILRVQPGDIFNNHWSTWYDPVRLMYRIFWTDPQEGTERGFQVRVVLHLVPITPHKTLMQSIVFTRFQNIKNKKSWIIRFANKFAVRFVRREVEDDANFITTVAMTPQTMSGMRLGKYDKPLVNNQKLLPAIYWQGYPNGLDSVPGRCASE